MSVNNVTIVSRATAPDSPSFPNIKLFTLAGAVLGLLLSAIYLIIKELMDTTIKDDEFMTNELGLTNLGHINHFHLNHNYRYRIVFCTIRRSFDTRLTIGQFVTNSGISHFWEVV